MKNFEQAYECFNNGGFTINTQREREEIREKKVERDEERIRIF